MRCIGNTINKPLSYYLEIFRSINCKRFNEIIKISHNEYISINFETKKLKYVNENLFELSFDQSLDKLTFTEYEDEKKSKVFMFRKYHRKTYTSISKYLCDAYYFQQSTIEEIHFSIPELIELQNFHRFLLDTHNNNCYDE